MAVIGVRCNMCQICTLSFVIIRRRSFVLQKKFSILKVAHKVSTSWRAALSRGLLARFIKSRMLILQLQYRILLAESCKASPPTPASWKSAHLLKSIKLKLIKLRHIKNKAGRSARHNLYQAISLPSKAINFPLFAHG